MKRRTGKKRSAIVPAAVFAAGLSVAAAVVPNIVGCDSDATMLGVAAEFADMARYGLDVAYHAFDMSVADLSETD
ncbi:MAG TPA: hypothetical protein VN947_08955 [Polyangia bacterium]|nr:hypothetical protein [Polyangia bacterium]